MDTLTTLPPITVARGTVRALQIEHGGIFTQLAGKQQQLDDAMAPRVFDPILPAAMHDNSWWIDKLRGDIARLTAMRDATMVELRAAIWTLDAVQRDGVL